MKSKKGVEMTLSTIIIVVILLITAFLLLYFFSENLKKGVQATSCEGQGGVYASSCDPDVSLVNPAFKKDEAGNLCCVRDPIVSQEEFQNWTKNITKKTTTTDTSNNQDQSSGFSGDNFYNIPTNQQNSNFIQLLFSNTDITDGVTTAIWEEDAPYLITAVNGVQDTEYCIVNVRQMSSSGELVNIVNSVESETCGLLAVDKAFQLELEGSFQETGNYQVDFVVREDRDSENIASARGLVQVRPKPIQPLLIDRNPPKVFLNGNNVDQTYRNNQNYCFIQAGTDQIENEDLDKVQYEYKLISRAETCTYTDLQTENTNFNYASLTGGIEIKANERACIKASYSYEFTDLDITETKTSIDTISISNVNEVSASETVPGCNYIVFISPKDWITSVCPTTCEQLTQGQCNSISAKASINPACVFGLDCYYRDPFIGTDRCVSCDFKTPQNCAQYKDQASCEENACLQDKCAWDIVNSRCYQSI